jgi:hypothetical protein
VRFLAATKDVFAVAPMVGAKLSAIVLIAMRSNYAVNASGAAILMGRLERRV